MRKIKKSSVFFFLSTVFFVIWALLKTVIKGAEIATPNMDIFKDNPISEEIKAGMSNDIKQVFNILALKEYLFILLIMAGIFLICFIIFKRKENKKELDGD